VSLVDAFIRWTPTSTWGFTLGQFKTPFSREYLLQPSAIEMADRAAVTESLPPKRDIGVMATYAVGSTATVLVGAFNGEGSNAVSNSDSAILAVGRVTVRPIAHLDIGANVAAYSSDSTRYGADAMLTSGPASARVEYIGEHRAAGGTDDYGWYVIGAYRVEPHVQLVLREEDLRRPAVAEPRNIATTAGANLDSTDRRVRFTIDYVSRQISATRSGTLIAQLQLTF
jgi:phosphate-selective porin